MTTVEQIKAARNALYDALPIGEVGANAFDLIKLIKEHLMKLDEITTPSPDVAGSDAVAFTEWTLGRYKHIDTVTTNGKDVEIWGVVDCDTKTTPPDNSTFTTADLYAKFNPNPQPAGASVEQAAHDYVKGMLGDYDPELQEEYDAILAHVLKGVEIAGAAFQAAQGDAIKEIQYSLDQAAAEGKLSDEMHRHFSGLVSRCQPAPAAVSAGTIRASEQIPPAGIYHAFYNGDHVLFQVHDGGFRVINYHGEKEDAPNLNLVKWVPDQTALAGIPDVRELVEGLEDVAKCMHLCPKCKRTVQNTITALAGIKRK